jgi:hypothetical protein
MDRKFLIGWLVVFVAWMAGCLCISPRRGLHGAAGALSHSGRLASVHSIGAVRARHLRFICLIYTCVANRASRWVRAFTSSRC